ncbi:unnamed protein product [Sphagnum tenellum]
MVKTCKVKVDKGTQIQEYDDDEYKKLICELSVSAKREGMLREGVHSGCPGVHDISGQPSQLKLLPSAPSGGAAEFRNISERHNFQGVCEPEESDLLASFGEDILHGNRNEMMGYRREGYPQYVGWVSVPSFVTPV